MTIGFLFWLIMLLCLFFGMWRGYSDPAGRYVYGMSLQPAAANHGRRDAAS